MNVLEKAEKLLETLKAIEGSAKNNEIQAAAGALGRCLGILGSRPNCARHFANLLHTAIPTLLSLASNDSAEIRLVGDEALNRAIVGGFTFHAYKTNIILQNQIDHTKSARWIRAALSRICLGDCWLRPGVGKIRSQASTLLPKLTHIVRQTTDVALIVEALESNLPRILNALAEYSTDEELTELALSLARHAQSEAAAVRRGAAVGAARACAARAGIVTLLRDMAIEKLWPAASESTVILGWFCVIKSLFQINDLSKIIDNNLFTVADYLELYQLCIHYIEQSSEHNIQNTVMECLSVMLSVNGEYGQALLDTRVVNISVRETWRDSVVRAPSRASVRPRSPMSERDGGELSFSGALHLGSLLQLTTPSLSVEDLTIQTPDSPVSEMEMPLNTEQLTHDLSEKLQEIEIETEMEREDQVDQPRTDIGLKVNIGESTDNDILLKYCARLLVSKFLLTGNKGGVISDRSVRVSVKSSALTCLSEILYLYPQAMTVYLDKDADVKCHNISGSSEGSDSNQDNINDFILERNICYQDSLTDSVSQDLNRSTDSQLTNNSQIMSKKDSKSMEKSQDSTEQKSSTKDVQSTILDSKIFRNELAASYESANLMTNSNVTTNSNTTGYPMTSSGDVLSSSIDLEMKFDHFGESTTNLDNLDSSKDVEKAERPKIPLRRTDEVHSKDAPELIQSDSEKIDLDKDFEFQHMSDVFVLLEGHSDPQIRGLVRVCIGNYLRSALDISHGNYYKWKNFSLLPKDVSDNIRVEFLVDIILKGLTDDIHSTVNHTLSSLISICSSLCESPHYGIMGTILNSLFEVETNKYWLCRVNLCKLYEKLPYERLFMLIDGYHRRSKLIMDSLCRLLGDQDHKVRKAAAQAIASITSKIYPPKKETPTSMVAEVARRQSQHFYFDRKGVSLDLVKDLYFYYDLPQALKSGNRIKYSDSLRTIVGDLMGRLMASNCKHYSQGLLEALQEISHKWTPWFNTSVYIDQGILGYCLDSLDYCNGTIAARSIMLDLCALMYPVEIHNIMRGKNSNRDVFERDVTNPAKRWQHLDNDRVASLAEKFLQVTLKMLNVLVHLIEEVNPNVHLNKSGIALPGSPVRRKTQDTITRKASIAEEDKGLKKKLPVPANSLKANFAGHFFNEPFYMKLYEMLRATHSNHKINLDPKHTIFSNYVSTVLDCLSIQLEFATEREFGPVTEELLFYMKVIMPVCPNKTVYAITQLLKCLFGTNMINQYSDFMTISPIETIDKKASFYNDVMLVNALPTIDDESRRSSVSSNVSQKLSLDLKNPQMIVERQLLMNLENFAKNKSDRKWSTNKKELERYIRLFEPVVIQALKSYTMQNDIPLQCEVLGLLNQLLTLRVNYCMLDSDQIFIGFLMKQLDLVEQHEIPNCCDLVNSILTFLVHLSSSKHHTKQIIEIPKLIQLCDGLIASGAHAECIAGLEPVVVKVFSNFNGNTVLGRTQQQEAQATREVLFYMLRKTMHQPKVLDMVSVVLCLSQEHPESYYRWSELACDTLMNLLAQRSIELDKADSISSLERLFDCIYKDVVLEQSNVEMLMKILFKAPPDQATTPYKLKLRYLSITMVLIRKVLVLIPESEILLTINYLKATYISPQSIFFNVKSDIDPLNVLNVNENCASLSPDVILVRFLFKTLTYAILEVDRCNEPSCGNFDLVESGDKGEDHRLLYSVCVNIIIQVKHMLHLSDGCLFPLTAKSAATLINKEQSGLNSGLYSPEENTPLHVLHLICLRRRALTQHWAQLLIRLNFISHKYWQKLVGFARNLPLYADNSDTRLVQVDSLQIACVLAYCEYFIENGLNEAVHLTWMLANRIHVLISHYHEPPVRALVSKVHATGGASGLLLQAAAARCQKHLKGEFALNTYKILSQCHESQSGALVFLICRIISKLEPSIAVKFSKLAIDRCRLLKDMTIEQINVQLTKEDVQVALELLQRDKMHIRFSNLVMELNALASSIFDLSPLDLSQDRVINPQYIDTTNVDEDWFVNQVKNRCCVADCTTPKVPKHNELALLLSNLTKAQLETVMSCQEFDRKILSHVFKVTCDKYCRDFLNVVSVYETKETERELIKGQREMMKMKEEMSASIDSNKLNVVNSLQVFKKSEKESKSQFFIPISDGENLKENFGNLEISDEDTEIVPPEIPEIYQVAVKTLDKSLTEIIRLFPKQNRPLSQSENFNLNNEHTLDRYTRRCHQVFQDKLFYQEFMTIQTILTGFLESLDKILKLLDETDCNILDKIINTIIPSSLAKNISTFSVMSLQYLSFIVKNKDVVETPANFDVSFRVTASLTDDIVVDNVTVLTMENVSNALSFKEIWSELNVESNSNRIQSAVSCLYAIVKYLVKDTKPLTLKQYMQTIDNGPKSDMMIIGDKLVTLIDYVERNMGSDVIIKCYRKPIESLLVSLCRLEILSNIALIPPMAWSAVDVSSKLDQLQKIDLPLQALQDLDALESFLYRVNLISWSSRKQFEEIWVCLLNALHGNGAHAAMAGLSRLLLSTEPTVRRSGILHVPRGKLRMPNGMQRLRNIVFGTSAYRIFDDVNLERVPMTNVQYHYAQFDTEYLKVAADICDATSFKVKKEVKRLKKNMEIDLNSCFQLLMDVVSQMLDPKSGCGISLLVNCIRISGGCLFTSPAQWCWAAHQLTSLTAATSSLQHYSTAARALLAALQTCLAVLDGFEGLQHELSSVHLKLVKSLSSGYAPLRQTALHGCLLQLTGMPYRTPMHMMNQSTPNSYQDLVTQLIAAVKQYLVPNAKISLYEQSLYWTVLFTLVELGHPDLIHIAIEFVLTNPRHYCTGLVVKGITNTLRQQVLPKELKNTIIEKLLENMKNYSEEHAIMILMVHLFSADNRLLSPKLTSDVSNMDPDILMNSMERITLLYKALRQSRRKESKEIVTSALKYFLKETLPPAATLSRVVIEFVESCKETERKETGVLCERDMSIDVSVLNAEVVFEVFETAVSQDQLPVLSGWIFEALCHLLNEKISSQLLPYCVLTLLVSASSNRFIRKMAALCFYILRLGFKKGVYKQSRYDSSGNFGVFKDYFSCKSHMSFSDRRLLCVVACKSDFSLSQLSKLRELCESNVCLEELMNCLDLV